MASYKFRDNGKVQITITHGKRFDGTPQRFYKEVNYSTDRQLEIDSALFLADIINGKIVPSNSSTIDTLFQDFIKNHSATSALKQSTIQRYKTIYEWQISPSFGKRQLNKITRTDVREWVIYLSSEYKNKKTNQPITRKTVKNALSLLHDMYNHAIYDLEIVDKNPCTKIKIPNDAMRAKLKTGNELYSEQETLELIANLQKERDNPKSFTHATLILLILFTGIRAGEMMGLTWNNVDLEKRELTIESSRLYVPDVGVITDTPKTTSSIRSISIPVFIVDMLKELRVFQDECNLKMGDQYHDSGFVAVTSTGSPHHPYNTYRWFKRFLKRYDLKDTTVHDLRHTHTAMLTRLGVKIIDISNRLGHENPKITSDTYYYLFADNDNQISDTLDQYYSNFK